MATPTNTNEPTSLALSILILNLDDNPLARQQVEDTPKDQRH